MSVLVQNCKMANATTKSSVVVLTENDILEVALERITYICKYQETQMRIALHRISGVLDT